MAATADHRPVVLTVSFTSQTRPRSTKQSKFASRVAYGYSVFIVHKSQLGSVILYKIFVEYNAVNVYIHRKESNLLTVMFTFRVIHSGNVEALTHFYKTDYALSR